MRQLRANSDLDILRLIRCIVDRIPPLSGWIRWMLPTTLLCNADAKILIVHFAIWWPVYKCLHNYVKTNSSQRQLRTHITSSCRWPQYVQIRIPLEMSLTLGEGLLIFFWNFTSFRSSTLHCMGWSESTTAYCLIWIIKKLFL